MEESIGIMFFFLVVCFVVVFLAGGVCKYDCALKQLLKRNTFSVASWLPWTQTLIAWKRKIERNWGKWAYNWETCTLWWSLSNMRWQAAAWRSKKRRCALKVTRFGPQAGWKKSQLGKWMSKTCSVATLMFLILSVALPKLLQQSYSAAKRGKINK